MDVACLLVPGFLVAIARRDNPQLARRPVVVGGSPEEHAQVTGCSREAAAAGVTIGTTLRRALALCPDAVFLPLQESQAQAEHARIAALLQRYSPAVEAVAPGHVHADVRGLARMAGLDEAAFFADLHEAALAETGLPVSLGVADTVFAAHAAAVCPRRPPPAPAPGEEQLQAPLFGERPPRPAAPRPARGPRPPGPARGHLTLVDRGYSRDYLARLPVEVLPVDPLMHQRLRLFGLERLGQVAVLSLSAMQAQFGKDGARAWQLASGQDDSRVVPAREELRIEQELELPAPTALFEPLVVGTRALIQRALTHPEINGQSVRRLDWRAGLESGEQVTRRFVFREPTNDAARMLFVVRQRIERLQLPAAAVAIAVTLSGICSEYGHQANLWPVGPRRHRELIDAVEQLNTRTGGAQVFRIVEVQPWSRIPERQLGLVAFGP
ncbi:MAG: hypothetical protein IT303_12290 [Dehalococcoidia bacterium]|nr:hypothetical protein [Dehalococcoidia bacterium]